MTLNQLRYLLGVVDHGFNITTAAEHLFTSQPGISKQLRLLEQELGVQIFARKSKNLLGLTPAGEQIVSYARKALRNVDNIKSVGKDLMAEQQGALSIATTHTQARYVLPEIISRFHQRYPQVTLELHQGTSEQIARLVEENRVDFAIATDSRKLFPELNLLPVYQWDRIVLARKNHPLALQDDALTIESLAEHPLITYVFSSNRRSSFLDAFSQAGLEPNVVFTARDADVIKTYVRTGMGVGVIAPMALEPEDLDDLVATCAKGMFPTVTTWIGVPRDRALRRYMFDFIELFAPHWPEHDVRNAVAAASQAEIDDIAADIELPICTGCDGAAQSAA